MKKTTPHQARKAGINTVLATFLFIIIFFSAFGSFAQVKQMGKQPPKLPEPLIERYGRIVHKANHMLQPGETFKFPDSTYITLIRQVGLEEKNKYQVRYKAEKGSSVTLHTKSNFQRVFYAEQTGTLKGQRIALSIQHLIGKDPIEVRYVYMPTAKTKATYYYHPPKKKKK